jgi:hypothetical protein
MALNTAIGARTSDVTSGARERARKGLEWSAALARSVARFAAGEIEDGTTARERRRQAIYEASGVHRGDSPDSDEIVFDLVDRHRAGL